MKEVHSTQLNASLVCWHMSFKGVLVVFSPLCCWSTFVQILSWRRWMQLWCSQQSYADLYPQAYFLMCRYHLKVITRLPQADSSWLATAVSKQCCSWSLGTPPTLCRSLSKAGGNLEPHQWQIHSLYTKYPSSLDMLDYIIIVLPCTISNNVSWHKNLQTKLSNYLHCNNLKNTKSVISSPQGNETRTSQSFSTAHHVYTPCL